MPELQPYWRFVRRRWLLLVLPTLVVAAIGVATYRPPGSFFNVGVRFLVGPAPTESAEIEDEQRLAAWQNSEYVVAALADWVEGRLFSAEIGRRLQAQGMAVPVDAIWKGGSGIVADYSRSQLTLSVTHGNRDELAAMIDAAIDLVLTENAAGIPQLGGEVAEIVLLDDPVINEIRPPVFDQLDLLARLALAVFSGLLLAVLADYLDNTIRDRREVERLELPLLGEIPGDRASK